MKIAQNYLQFVCYRKTFIVIIINMSFYYGLFCAICYILSFIVSKIIEYLIEIKNNYKIESEKLILIYKFNIKKVNEESCIEISKNKNKMLKLPTRIVDFKFKGDNIDTVELYLDNGWQLSFNISIVEFNILLNIEFIGVPIDVLTIECKWK